MSYSKLQKKEKDSLAAYVGVKEIEHFKKVARMQGCPLSQVIDHVLSKQMMEDLEDGIFEGFDDE